MSELLVIVDMSALAFRSHFAFVNRPLTRGDGFTTSALFGTCQSLLNMLEKHRPSHVLCALDSKEKTFRHEIYSEYKAHRPDCPVELAAQLEKLEELCSAFSLTSLRAPGYEADDIIAHAARLGQKAGMEVLIYSGDKDFMQLLDPKTRMLITHRGGELEVLGAEGIAEKLGVEPHQVADYLALVGDASDNVPGAPGVGKVTASQLLQEHKNLDGIFSAAPNFKKKGLSAKILDHREQIELSRRLVELCFDVPEFPTLESMGHSGLEGSIIIPFLKEMEFPKILARVEAVVGQGDLEEKKATFPQVEVQFMPWREFLALAPEGELSLWLESCEAGWEVGLHSGGDSVWVCPLDDVNLLLEWLVSRSFTSAQGKSLLHLNPELEKGCDDLLLMASVLHQGGRDTSIEKLAENELGVTLPELGKKGSKKRKFVELESSERQLYVAERARASSMLALRLKEHLEEKGLWSVYETIERPLLSVIVEMERQGVKVDAVPLQQQSEAMAAELSDLTTDIHGLAGEEFNIASTQQLGKVLFEKMKIQDELSIKVKKTKTGFSTDSSVLESLGDHPMGKALLRYRFLSKLKSTYLDALPAQMDESTGRIHTTYHQNGTSTGRLSSQDPNLQNIPMRVPEGARIREAFVPSHGGDVLVAADYSQIELRVLAHFSRDQAMGDAFRTGQDIHAATAAKIHNIAVEDVSSSQRSNAKAVNFGLLYGMGPKLLSTQTGLSFSEARQFIKAYFETFPSIRDFMEFQVQKAREAGFAGTLAGRKRWLPDLESSNGMRRSQAENMALNTPIQGSAADIIKWAMLRLHRRILAEGLPMKMLMQVHDELVFECSRDQVERCCSIIKEEMESTKDLPSDFDIPLVVELGLGRHWLEAH